MAHVHLWTLPLVKVEELSYRNAVQWRVGRYHFLWDRTTLFLILPNHAYPMIPITNESLAIQFSVGWVAGRNMVPLEDEPPVQFLT